MDNLKNTHHITFVEKDSKNKIEKHCIRNPRNVCPIKQPQILSKLTEDQERKLKLKQMKDKIVQEIMNNVRGINHKQIKNNIVKEIVKNIQG